MTAPEWRRTTRTNSLVTHFKVASTARRLDRENGRWVDGNSLRVRVNCWRKLAEGVASSVMVGDPVVVVGRLYNRDWVDGDGTHRTSYEMEAIAVGHDLSRGRSRFARNKPTLSTSVVEDPEADTRVHGLPSEAVPSEQAPARRGELFDDPDPGFFDSAVPMDPGRDEVAALRGGGFEHTRSAHPPQGGDRGADGAAGAGLEEGDGTEDDAYGEPYTWPAGAVRPPAESPAEEPDDAEVPQTDTAAPV